MDDKREIFDKYINELDNLFEENPKIAIKEAKMSLDRIKREANNEKRHLLKEGDLDTFFLCILILLIILIGLFNIKEIGLYLFGVAFFVAGYFAGTKLKKFGLIFLFSHGVTGMCLMIGVLIKDVYNNPAFFDNAQNIYVYMGIGIILLLVALIMTILYNLSDVIQKERLSVVKPLALFFIVFLMCGLLPRIFDFLYNFHFNLF